MAKDNLSLTTKASPHSDVLSKNLEDEEVLLNLESGNYFGLNRVGSEIWQGIKDGATVGEISEALASKYQVPLNHAQEDTLKIFSSLLEHQLIELN